MFDNKKNNLWLGLQFFVSLIVSFVTLKLNLMNYGTKYFGIWITLASVWGIGSVLDFGFGIAIVKYVAEANKNGDTKRINVIYSTGLLLFLSIGILIVLAGNVIAELIFYRNINIVPLELKSIMQLVFFILGISFYFQYVAILFRCIFEGLNNFVISSKLSIVNSLLIFTFVIIVTILKMSIVFLSISYMTASFCTFLFYYLTLRLKHREFYFSKLWVEFAEIKKMFVFSINVQITALIGAFIDPVIKYIISNYASVGIVPFYEVARRFSLAISGLFSTSFRTIIPQTSILKSREEYSNYLLHDGAQVLKLGMAYSGIIFGCGAMFFTLIIKFWFGYTESIIIFFILSLQESINNLGVIVYLFFIGIGRAGYLIINQLTNVILMSACIILGFLFFKNYLGLFGCFISVLIGNILMLIFLKIETGISITIWLKEIKIYKLFTFFALNILSIIFLFNKANIFIVTSALSLLSAILFITDIKYYSNIVIKMIKSKIVAFS